MIYSWQSLIIVFCIALTQAAQEWPSGYLVDRDTCSNQQVKAISAAVQRSGGLTLAALKKIDSADQTLFRYFFRDEDRDLVRHGFQSILQMLQRKGPSALLSCQHELCAINGTNALEIFKKSDLEGLSSPPKLSTIILCTPFFQRPKQPDPCDRKYLEFEPTSPRAYTAATLILHETLHIPYLMGLEVNYTVDLMHTAYTSHTLTQPVLYGYNVTAEMEAKYRPRRNVASYVLFAVWAWMEARQQSRCPGSYPLWDMFESSADEAENAAFAHARQPLSVMSSSPVGEDATSLYLCSGTCSISFKQPDQVRMETRKDKFNSISIISGLELSITGSPSLLSEDNA